MPSPHESAAVAPAAETGIRWRRAPLSWRVIFPFMKYRARSLATGVIVYANEEFAPANNDPVWVLEFELDTDEWQVSGYHQRGVMDPRPFKEIKPHILEDGND